MTSNTQCRLMRTHTLEICLDTPVPLPSFNEQREIVRRIETAFAKIDRLEAEAAKAPKLLGRLDQRILACPSSNHLRPIGAMTNGVLAHLLPDFGCAAGE